MASFSMVEKILIRVEQNRSQIVDNSDDKVMSQLVNKLQNGFFDRSKD